MEDEKQIGTKPPENIELRCTKCDKVLSSDEVVDNGEYIVPVSKCCTAYIREYKILNCGTMKV